MAKFYNIFILLILTSCINDFSFYHDSILESKEHGLLICEYKSNKQHIIIANKKYIVVEAWTAYKFKTRGSNEIYKDFFAFTFILEDEFNNKEPNLEIALDYIYFKEKDTISLPIGIVDSQYRVLLNNKLINNLDTIQFRITESKDKYSTLTFTKR